MLCVHGFKRFETVKMSALPNLIYRFNAMPIKLPRIFLRKLSKYNFCREKNNQISQHHIERGDIWETGVTVIKIMHCGKKPDQIIVKYKIKT